MRQLTYKHDILLLAKSGVASLTFFQWIRDILDRLNAISPKVGDLRLSTDPDLRVGELECDGSDVSRATYAALFEVIGTDYGVGNGSTTFTLPAFSSESLRYFVRVD
jgi:hypothetical protein